MRKAAMVLGIIGGAIGLFSVYIILDWGIDFRVHLVPGTAWFFLCAAWIFLSSLVAIGGGVLALTRPKVAGVLMLSSIINNAGAGFLLALEGPSLPPIVLLIVYLLASSFLASGGILALISSRERPVRTWVVLTGIIAGLLGGPVVVYLGPFLISLLLVDLLYWVFS
ncbi:hypothetical protein M1N47_01390 [Dehalococcoidia bacterium]|nr:hypothetical protein [Dehalococcoidia bacterium]